MNADRSFTSRASLMAIKFGHTIVRAFVVGSILAIPITSLLGAQVVAAWLIAVVAFEVAVLAINHWHYPLTSLAALFTANRAPNFDIYLPAWVAAYNKPIFGTLYG